MKVNQLNECIKAIVSEIADLEVQAIESWDILPIEIPLTFRYKVIENVYKRFGINPSQQLLQDGLNMYYSETILDAIYGRAI